MKKNDRLQEIFDTTPIPEEIQSELASLSMEKLDHLAEEAKTLLESKDVPRSYFPIIVAIIKEFGHRHELMERQVEELLKETDRKNREYQKLKHETHRLQQQLTHLKHQACEKETTGSFTPRRNDPCPCGSGKKYKHCCGK